MSLKQKSSKTSNKPIHKHTGSAKDSQTPSKITQSKEKDSRTRDSEEKSKYVENYYKANSLSRAYGQRNNAKSGTNPTTHMDENEQYDSELEEFPEEAKERADQRDIGDYSLLRRIQTAPFSSNIKMVRTKTAIMEDEFGENVEDLFMKNGYYQSKGEFSLKNSAQQDCYFKNMNDFVDEKLQCVVEKIADKKSLSTVNNSLRVLCDNLGKEINSLLKENGTLTKEYNKEFDANKANNEECDELQNSLNNLREKIESIRISEHETINSLRDEENNARAQYNYNQHEFNLQKNIWKDELKGQNNEINLLEEQNRQAQTSLKEYASRHKYCSKLEHEKTMIFKEKNKILTQLMNDEKPTLKATTNKRVFDLTKDFCK